MFMYFCYLPFASNIAEEEGGNKGSQNSYLEGLAAYKAFFFFFFFKEIIVNPKVGIKASIWNLENCVSFAEL